ncbi:hypothetical protein JX266_005778 [Neoarthrinium moseri]|nr:hypothetical protein JX266_005778 [Neoarthrinium moseri]
MAIVASPSGSRLQPEKVKALLTKAGLSQSEALIDDWCVLLGSFEDSIQDVLKQEDDLPRPNLAKYPRSEIQIPKDATESDKGGWATICIAKSIEPVNSLLDKKKVALKDNIALAGIRCLNGMNPLGREWVPGCDATVATRIMDAGATIVGKATCENACMEPSSDTSWTGIVHNPYADYYACGGSSSGSGRVVATGSADMALGCDQGGSVRIPAAFCGLVGLKPTWGLVPYTGILGLHAEIDHCGPMSRTVRDNALLLEAIAGPDGLDDRQPRSMPTEALQYSNQLDRFMRISEAHLKPLSGFKIGVLKEGFDLPMLDSNVEKAVRSAVADLAALGAEVIDVSIPEHHQICVSWTCTQALAGGRDGLLGQRTGRKELYMTDITGGPGCVSQERFDAWGPGAQNLYMKYLYVVENHGATVNAKASNLIRKQTRAYDAILSSLDALVMPTIPFPATPSFREGEQHGPLERLVRMAGTILNTAPFNATGHPALSVPVGFVPALDNQSIKLPAALQIVGKAFDEMSCFKIAASWERIKDWKSIIVES